MILVEEPVDVALGVIKIEGRPLAVGPPLRFLFAFVLVFDVIT